MSGGRWLRRISGALLFTTGTLVAATTAYGAFGLLGLGLGGWIGFRAWAGVVFLWGLVWHGARLRTFPGSRRGVQARRDLATGGTLGPLYFGVVLGTGLLTEAATPLVHVGPLVGLGWGPGVGIAYGTGFAVGRSLPSWGAVALGDRLAPHTVTTFFVENRERLRRVGAVVSLGGAVLAAVGLWAG